MHKSCLANRAVTLFTMPDMHADGLTKKEKVLNGMFGSKAITAYRTQLVVGLFHDVALI